MKDISIPFSLFDFFAVLMPGAVGLSGLYLFVNPSLTQAGHEAVFSGLAFLQFESDLVTFTLFILASYLMGQVLNALAVMFQTLALTLIIIATALIRGYWIGALFADSFFSLALAIVLILILIGLLFWSYRRYKRMWSTTVAMSFVAWVNPGQGGKGRGGR